MVQQGDVFIQGKSGNLARLGSDGRPVGGRVVFPNRERVRGSENGKAETI